MAQELLMHWPAFRDVIALTPKSEEVQSIDNVPLKVSRENIFTNRRIIPLGWFKNESFRNEVAKKHGATSEQAPMVRLIFNTTPVVRVCNAGDPDERHSNPEIVEWNSLGGWTAARADQSFKAPDWVTKFIQL